MPVEKACDLKYIRVETILAKETKYDVITGLFMGIVEEDGQRLVLLAGTSKGHANLVNLKFYNLMSLEVLKDSTRELTYLTAVEEDQKEGLKLLEEAYKEALEAGFALENDDKIIDIGKYKGVPAGYSGSSVTKKSTSSSNTTTTTTPGVGNFATSTNHSRYYNNNNRVTSFANTTVKTEPKPTLFERGADKKPTKDALEALQEALDLIQAGSYEPNLPAILEDEEEPTDTTTAKTVEEDEEPSYFGGMY